MEGGLRLSGLMESGMVPGLVSSAEANSFHIYHVPRVAGGRVQTERGRKVLIWERKKSKAVEQTSASELWGCLLCHSHNLLTPECRKGSCSREEEAPGARDQAPTGFDSAPTELGG